MLAAGGPSSAHSIELALLRALCASPDLHASLAQMTAVLPHYRWQVAEHAMLYEALCKVPSRDKRPLRGQLPAIATRMGFPDVEWESYFAPRAPSEPELLELLRKLERSAATRT